MLFGGFFYIPKSIKPIQESIFETPLKRWVLVYGHCSQIYLAQLLPLNDERVIDSQLPNQIIIYINIQKTEKYRLAMCQEGDRGPLHSITMAAPARPGCCYVSFPSSSGNIKGKYTKGRKGTFLAFFFQCLLQLQQYFPSTNIRGRCLTTNTAKNQNNVFTFRGSLIFFTKLSTVTTTHIHYHPKPTTFFLEERLFLR